MMGPPLWDDTRVGMSFVAFCYFALMLAGSLLLIWHTVVWSRQETLGALQRKLSEIR